MCYSDLNYALMREDDPEEECKDWFWTSLNEDDVYPKEFLEHLLQMCEDVELGKVKTYSIDEVMDKLKNELDIDDETTT